MPRHASAKATPTHYTPGGAEDVILGFWSNDRQRQRPASLQTSHIILHKSSHIGCVLQRCTYERRLWRYTPGVDEDTSCLRTLQPRTFALFPAVHHVSHVVSESVPLDMYKYMHTYMHAYMYAYIYIYIYI